MTGSKISVCGALECRAKFELGWILLSHDTIPFAWTVFGQIIFFMNFPFICKLDTRFQARKILFRGSALGTGWRALYSVTIFCKERRVL